ncbi:hypothetical protein F5879DRAFT_952567 [Lentinula edodes]|uniref:HAMP LIKE histidine kinase n=1 Tax=Lentinula edodes TaxID=5353 RepID=A0A1Q3E054_LENED|nr:hypothetical protein F5879DRAFT_952567 [Lentinula edodes]KAJ3921821.1 hypothetical protein F5877DRAFT_64631 [Lentinula edodes]GAW00494.1 HAMP LIKE histidine kinase [Lentinula edodes]
MQNTASSFSSNSPISGTSPAEFPPVVDVPIDNSSMPVEILKRPAAARKKKLEDDPWTADVSTVSVTCLGCGHLVRLSTKSLYDNHHWLMHKQRCKRAGNMKGNSDIGASPQPSVLAQAKYRPNTKSNRKTKRAPSASSSVSSLTPISTPPLTSDEEDDVDVSSTEESEPPPRPIPIRAPGKRDLLTEQYFARAHGIRIRLPPIPPDAPDTQNDWRNWKWSELRMPEFTTSAPPLPDSNSDSSEVTCDPDVPVKSQVRAQVEGPRILRSSWSIVQPRERQDPSWRPSSSYHA